jgi:DNA-binding XRE family transcriptional regulator
MTNKNIVGGLDISNLALNLNKFRNEAGFTVEDLAWEIGVSSRVVYDYESGKKKPSLETAVKIAIVLNIALDIFF